MWNAVKVVAKDIESMVTLSLSDLHNALCAKTTPVGFEPTRGDPIGLAGRRLNRSAKVSLRGVNLSVHQGICKIAGQRAAWKLWINRAER